MTESKKRKESKFSGISIALWLLVMGITAFYIPAYFGSSNNIVITLFNIIGWLFIAISIFGTLSEVSNLVGNEGFSTVGISLVFLVPCGVLFANLENGTSGALLIIGKICVIILFVLGTGMLFYGIADFFPDGWAKQTQTQDSKFFDKFKTFLKGLTAVLGAIAALLTAVLKLIDFI